MVQCNACGGVHVHEGTVSLAHQPGEIEVDGHRYALRDVRAVIALPEPEGAAIPRATFDLMLVGGLALAALSVLQLWM